MADFGIKTLAVVVLYLGMTIFVVTSLSLAYRDYKTFLSARMSAVGPIKKFLAENCHDSDKIIRTAAVDDCNRRQLASGEDPWEYSLYDTFELWGFCGKGGCKGGFAEIAKPLQLVVATAVLTVMITIACGVRIVQNLSFGGGGSGSLPSVIDGCKASGRSFVNSDDLAPFLASVETFGKNKKNV